MLLVAYDKNGIVKETTVLTPKNTEFIGNKYLYDRRYRPCTGWQSRWNPNIILMLMVR